ncbi:hypothetical protein PROFUN_07919 [Planoprotostelium fungivorum]|uniref:Uncharacterized protein n=1 Tax=Planoprotostelium fungivorum TaxID=1890364 RepID=A0A2P6NL51_9EUKA|nr:hypothetical protein PROFUN_07919 [Planoprotostelium fungivorum]
MCVEYEFSLRFLSRPYSSSSNSEFHQIARMEGGDNIPTTISPTDKAKYDQLFATADTNGDGVIDGLEGKNFFSYSQLSKDNLAKIWFLCDNGRKGHITKLEFRCTLRGFTIPPQLPPVLKKMTQSEDAPEKSPAEEKLDAFGARKGRAPIPGTQPTPLVPLPHIAPPLVTDWETARKTASEWMKQVFVELEMGNYARGFEVVQNAYKILEPHAARLVKEVEICRNYADALELLLEMKEAEDSEEMVLEAILARFLGDLMLQPKHRLVLMRMAANKNFSVGNFGISARFIRNILKLNPLDEAALSAKLELCQENRFEDMNIPPYTCPQCKKSVSPAPINCKMCNIPIQAKYFLDICRKKREEERKQAENRREEEEKKKEERRRREIDRQREMLRQEEQKKEDERQEKLRDSARRKQETERRIEEIRREEEEKKRREEEKKRREEQNKRREEERKRDEAEKQKREEEERKRDEEEKQKREEERRKRREEEERKYQSEEREIEDKLRREREERRRREEQIEEENKRREEDRRRREEEEKKKMEENRKVFEEKRRREEEEKKRQEEQKVEETRKRSASRGEENRPDVPTVTRRSTVTTVTRPVPPVPPIHRRTTNDIVRHDPEPTSPKKDNHPAFLSKKTQSLAVEELSSRINEQLRIRNERVQKLNGIPVMGRLSNAGQVSTAGAALPPSIVPPNVVHSGPTATGHAIPTRNKREEIVNEIILTERKYVDSLRNLIEIWYKPLLGSGLVQMNQIRTIFGVIEIIYSTNQVLLSNLEEAAGTWTEKSCIAHAFSEIVPYLKVYTAYVNNANLSIVTAAELSNASADFHKFLEDCKSRCNGLDLQSFLILPIQRIPRYVLLLKDLSRNTSEDHPDYSGLMEALAKIEDVAIYVNEKKREAENMTTVMRIQEQVVFDSGREEPLVQPHRRLIKKGKLVERDESSVRKKSRVCFLFNDIFMVTKPKLISTFSSSSKGRSSSVNEADLDGLFTFVKRIHLSTCDVADVALEMEDQNESKKRTFVISERVGSGLKESHNRRRFVFIANSDEDKLEWVQATREVCEGLNEREKKRQEAYASSNQTAEGDLTSDDWTLLMTNSKRKNFSRGEVIIKADSRNHSLVRIVSGQARAVLNRNTSYSTDFVIYSGTAFGYRSFVGDGTGMQTRDIVADTDVVVEVVEVSFVLRLFQVEPQVAGRFYGTAARTFERRLRSMEEEKRQNSVVEEKTESSETEGLKKNALFLQLFPELADENILRAYYCTFRRNITHYGRIYITQNYIAFWANRMFGVTKQKTIPLSAVVKIEKEKSYLEITRSKGSNTKISRFTFDRKAERDDVMNVLESLLDGLKPNSSQIVAQSPLKLSMSGAFQLLQSDLPTKVDWDLMLRDAEMLTFRSGQVIVEEGSSHQRIYQIISGQCRVEKKNTTSTPTLLSVIPPGEIFGEISFLEKGEASASVRAASERVEVCVVEGNTLYSLFQNTPGLSGRFYKFLAGVTLKRLQNREKALQKEAVSATL